MFREVHIKVVVSGLEVANAMLPSPFCTNPMLPLAATLAIFKAMLDTDSLALKDKEHVTESSDYLAKG